MKRVFTQTGMITMAVAAAVLTLVEFVSAYPADVSTGSWTQIAVTTTPRSGACAATLADGRVLISGGIGTAGTLNSSEILGSDGSFAAAAAMSAARSRHSCTTLEDGRVLVAGGVNDAGVSSQAEIYDPGTNAWHSVGAMTNARASHTATRLEDGRVLIAGGQGPSAASNSLEVFDPSTSAFTVLSTGLLSSARKEHVAALLADGRVLIAGGDDGSNALATTNIYDSSTGAVAGGAAMLTPRSGATATLLLDGMVLIAGGSRGAEDLATAEIYDPVAGRFTETGQMTSPRHGHLAFRLPNNNQVLLVGGDATGRSAELFTPWRGSFQATGSLNQDRVDAVGAPIGSQGLLFLAGGRTKRAQGTLRNSSTAYRFATVTPDSETYAPGSTVTLKGSGWQPGEKVRVQVQERSKGQADSLLTTTADSFGDFETQYLMAQVPDRHYSFTATGMTSEAVARASTGEAANLNQCQDGAGLSFPLSGSNTGCNGGWVNGNVNGSKATYFEGDSLPYQTVMTGITTISGNSHTLQIQWDTTSGNKHAVDYITTYNRSVTKADECQGVANCVNPPTSTYAIPADPRVLAAGVTLLPGNFIMWGGTITGVSAYSYVGPADYSSSTSAGLSITFTATSSTVVLGWGGHIATHVDWPGLSAVTLSGSPFHTRLQGLDGASVGSQDRALALSAAVFPFTLQVNKVATGASAPAAGFSFGITATPTYTGSTGLLTNPFALCGASACTTTSGDIFPSGGNTTFSSYQIVETPPTGWNTPTSVCTTSGGLSGTNNTFASDGTTLAFTPKQGDNVVCTYNNTAAASTVTLTKSVIPSGDAGQFTLTIGPGDASCSKSGGGGTSVSCSEVFGTSVTVGETGSNLTNYTSSISCSWSGGGSASGTTSVTFSMPAAAVTCTATNTRKQHNVTLTKMLSPSTDGGLFNLTITDTTNSSSKTTPAPVGNNGNNILDNSTAAQ